MKLSRWSLLLVLGLLLSMFLAACSGGDSGSDADGGDDSAASDDVEQVFNFINGDKIPTMDSSLSSDEYGSQFLGATTEGLYRLDENAEISPGIAKDHKVSDDALTYTFELRDDAEWENGDPVTAHDFVYAWQRAVDPDTGSEFGPLMMSGVIKNAEAVNSGDKDVDELGVKAEDDYTLVVELENPVPYFDSLVTYATFLPLNEKFVDEQGDKYATSSDTLLANGPFKLEDWKSTSDSWNLVKNDTYWDADTVQLEKMTYKVVKDAQTQVDLFEKGEIDRAGLDSDLVDEYISNEDFVATPLTGVFYLKFNQTRNEALANTNIRLALSRAFDKNALVDQILNNGSLVATGLIPQDFVTVPGTEKDFREASGDLVEYDLDKAKEYWEKGLEELGTDSVELEFLAGDSDVAKNMNEYIVDQLEKNLDGLSLKLKQVPFEQTIDLDSAMDYDIQFAGWGPDFLDPNAFMSLWVTDGSKNHMGYSDEKYDKLIESTTKELATDQEKRYQAFIEAEKVLFEDAALAPIYQKAMAQLVSPKVEGVFVNPFGQTYEYKWSHAADVE